MLASTGTSDPELTLVRLWEQDVLSGNITITFSKGINYTKATPINLRGEVIGKLLNVEAGKLLFFLKGYAPASFVLSPGS